MDNRELSCAAVSAAITPLLLSRKTHVDPKHCMHLIQVLVNKKTAMCVICKRHLTGTFHSTIMVYNQNSAAHIPTVASDPKFVAGSDDGAFKANDSCAGDVNSIRIDDIEMNVRLYNALRNAQIQTIGDLAKMRPGSFLKLTNVGHKTLAEAHDMMQSLGLDW